MSASFFNKVIYVVPAAFVIGWFLQEYRSSSIEEDRIVEKKIKQRLGEWVPPVLSPEVCTVEERRYLFL